LFIQAGKKSKLPHPDSKPWLGHDGKRGWTVPFWPKEYGGGGLDRQETRVLQEGDEETGVADPR